MAYLIIVRHGESEWNALGKWAGLTDVALTEMGRREARQAARHLQGITINKAYVSQLKRAKQTLSEIKNALNLSEIPDIEHEALNERDYGELTGLNKRDHEAKVGPKAYKTVSRGWNTPAPNGESLKMVHDRVTDYYKNHILKDLKEGKNIIVVSHHNPLRALVKYIEDIPEDKIAEVTLGTSELYIYELDEDGRVIGKVIRGGNTKYQL